ncbi:Tm-1-like ATP-binding domain-containing protein [Arenibacter sp. GZD96]|uniref:Tm-1-like ATP-binding domain-containing protein n=1 Tax=Aurantibrevibacter litoralis TaxID=3106030 RepID=UPI002AFDECCE|nr:Tm-1-like ATP-binding domain-containing protein [Arenibacter sp. GZD-96]MEA1784853.1 Tm-1-like ATP-binding domain-containing protein [Arenibacter sp. GZD-96]
MSEEAKPISPFQKTIVMLGCFDTKGADFEYLYTLLKALNPNISTINMGVLGTTDLFPVDYEAQEVAQRGGSELHELRLKEDRSHAIKIMGKGAAKIVAQLQAQDKVQGIIGMGGGGGTYMALTAMKALKLGIPKLCLSTIATKDLSSHIGAKDISLMPSIVDVAGLNSISRIMIRQAAGAITGMVNSTEVDTLDNTKSIAKSIAISVFGNTTLCVDHCTEQLKSKGYDVLSFHSVGVGGITMESLTMEGCFDAILDITTTELADELCGGICSAGSDRLKAGSTMGIPQVIAPGCLDMVNFGPMDTVPEKYKNRHLYSWGPDVTLMRTNKEENRILGKIIAERINRSEGPVTVLLPLGGLSKIGAVDGVFYAPETDRELFNAIRENVHSGIQIKEVNANINTVDFAREAVKSMLEILEN